MKLEWIKPKKWWHFPTYRLLEDLVIGNHRIPNKFISNGANVPFFLRWILSPMGIWARAAFLHDWLLSQNPNRKHCAKEFKKALALEGVPGFLIPVFYAGVRLWDRYRSFFPKK